MNSYHTKAKKITGSNYEEVMKKARFLFHQIEGQSRRKAYIRSAYFNREKIFFDLFWQHLNQKSRGQRLARLTLFPCAVELIKYSYVKPISKINPNKKREILNRFIGINGDKENFYVQIKEDCKTRKKYLMSVFAE